MSGLAYRVRKSGVSGFVDKVLQTMAIALSMSCKWTLESAVRLVVLKFIPIDLDRVWVEGLGLPIRKLSKIQIRLSGASGPPSSSEVKPSIFRKAWKH